MVGASRVEHEPHLGEPTAVIDRVTVGQHDAKIPVIACGVCGDDVERVAFEPVTRNLRNEGADLRSASLEQPGNIVRWRSSVVSDGPPARCSQPADAGAGHRRTGFVEQGLPASSDAELLRTPGEEPRSEGAAVPADARPRVQGLATDGVGRRRIDDLPHSLTMALLTADSGSNCRRQTDIAEPRDPCGPRRVTEGRGEGVRAPVQAATMHRAPGP